MPEAGAAFAASGLVRQHGWHLLVGALVAVGCLVLVWAVDRWHERRLRSRRPHPPAAVLPTASPDGYAAD